VGCCLAGIRVVLSRFMRCPCAGRHLLFFAAANKSRQKKAAHTASPCCYPRALNVPVFHSATCQLFFVASALIKRVTCSHHFFNGTHQRFVSAHFRQTVCRRSHREARCSCQKTFCAPTCAARSPTHRLPQRGREGSACLTAIRVLEVGEASHRGLATGNRENVVA